MFLYTIEQSGTQKTLYSGHFHSMRACVEQAVSEGVNLYRANLQNANLLNAQLDGGNFQQANFSGANMTGVNASECTMQDCRMNGVILYGAALCESDLSGADFTDAAFGATDITDAIMQGCVFSTLSAFQLSFIDTCSMEDCLFKNPCGTTCPMSRPPVVIHGLQYPVVLMDRHIKIGHDAFLIEHDIHAPFAPAFGQNDPRLLRMHLEQIAALKHLRHAGKNHHGARPAHQKRA